MWTLHTTNDDHWVPIETVASFKRMREFKSFGTPWIVEALKTSEQLEVDESDTKLRRRSEVQEPKGQFERSIYAVRPPSAHFTRRRRKLPAGYRKASARRHQTSRRSLKFSSTNMAIAMPFVCAATKRRSLKFVVSISSIIGELTFVTELRDLYLRSSVTRARLMLSLMRIPNRHGTARSF